MTDGQSEACEANSGREPIGKLLADYCPICGNVGGLFANDIAIFSCGSKIAIPSLEVIKSCKADPLRRLLSPAAIVNTAERLEAGRRAAAGVCPQCNGAGIVEGGYPYGGIPGTCGRCRGSGVEPGRTIEFTLPARTPEDLRVLELLKKTTPEPTDSNCLKCGAPPRGRWNNGAILELTCGAQDDAQFGPAEREAAKRGPSPSAEWQAARAQGMLQSRSAKPTAVDNLRAAVVALDAGEIHAVSQELAAVILRGLPDRRAAENEEMNLATCEALSKFAFNG